MRWWKLVGLVVAVLLLGWLIDFFLHWKERQVELVIERAAQAIQEKQIDSFLQTLDPSFTYDSSVALVGKGNLDSAQSKLSSFWSYSNKIYVLIRDAQIEVHEIKARAELRGNIKCELGSAGSLAIYKYRLVLDLHRVGEEWKILHVEVPELAPGIF